MLFAAIADDYTGGSDLAGMLALRGVRTAQLFGVPAAGVVESLEGRYDALVVCLKSRSIEAEEARRVSMAALDRLQAASPRQIQFKYCSTFDSTSRGNIGPVTDALMDALGVEFTVAAPGLPVNGRTQYMGYLFVNGVLLSESPMRDHPLNPMREPNLVRHLEPQTRRKVGLIAHPAVRAGAAVIREKIAGLRTAGIGIALVDVVSDCDLTAIANAVATEKLITGGSGIARALPAVWRERGWHRPVSRPEEKVLGGNRRVLLLAGSCSAATLKQIEVYRASGAPFVAVDIEALMHDAAAERGRLTDEAARALKHGGRCLIYSSTPAGAREETLRRIASNGRPAGQVPAAIEELMGRLASDLVGAAGVRRIVAAGGETSGAILDAIGVKAVEILDELDPGVPALRSLDDPPFGLALKSGNFGAPDCLLKAAGYLEKL
ncbi:MAG: 3-oxo-tetronate kinase [Bryobacteraceae bacterium]